VTRRRRVLFAAVAVISSAAILLAIAVAIDVLMHRRVQRQAGVNVWGYRGPTVGRKHTGETRIVALGGSTAFGYGLPWNEAWPFYLERLLDADGGRQCSVINLGAPGQGAYGFTADLADYAYLQYDVAILYEGYNDLGRPMDFDRTEGVVNHYQWRRQSPVFRLTGYFPILPLVFREKAMQLRAGGDLDAAYRGEVHFTPGLATRASASALSNAAAVADSLERRLGRLTEAPALSHAPLDRSTWSSYVESVVAAVRAARARRAAVVVAGQPYLTDAHVEQQRALAAALHARFKDDPGVRYVDLGTVIDIHDRNFVYDGLHLNAAGNRIIAEHLVHPVRDLTQGSLTS
jgi:lysophospholipase L1-like esterase